MYVLLHNHSAYNEYLNLQSAKERLKQAIYDDIIDYNTIKAYEKEIEEKEEKLEIYDLEKEIDFKSSIVKNREDLAEVSSLLDKLSKYTHTNYSHYLSQVRNLEFDFEQQEKEQERELNN